MQVDVIVYYVIIAARALMLAWTTPDEEGVTKVLLDFIIEAAFGLDSFNVPLWPPSDQISSCEQPDGLRLETTFMGVKAL